MKKKNIFSVVLILCFCMLFMSGCGKTILPTRTSEMLPTDIAILNIFSYDGAGESNYGIINLGHSFLSIENKSSAPIELAGKEIGVGEELYLGAWSLSIHFGIWYNVENNYIDLYNKYNGRISVGTGINAEDLETLSNCIIDNDTWNPIRNCSYFALTMWNSVANENEMFNIKSVFNTPKNVKEQIMTFTNCETNKALMPTGTSCGYFADLTRTTFKFEGGQDYA